MPRLLARNDRRKMSRNNVKPVVVARSKASAERRGNLAKSLGTEGRDCFAGWLAITEGRDCFADWLAMTESRLARNDGKIIVVARSKASAERRGNLAKSLGTEGRDCFAGWLAMTDERWLAMTENL